jgi:hypothetical protein
MVELEPPRLSISEQLSPLHGMLLLPLVAAAAGGMLPGAAAAGARGGRADAAAVGAPLLLTRPGVCGASGEVPVSASAAASSAYMVQSGVSRDVPSEEPDPSDMGLTMRRKNNDGDFFIATVVACCLSRNCRLVPALIAHHPTPFCVPCCVGVTATLHLVVSIVCSAPRRLFALLDALQSMSGHRLHSLRSHMLRQDHLHVL